MELLKRGVRRTQLGELAYVAINAALPVALLLLVLRFGSAYPALMLILLSKWRIFALRPRFWWMNIKANAVDILVGVSVVGLMYLAIDPSTLVSPFEVVLAMGFGVWLLFIKPRSSATAILWQAGIAQFLALTTLFSLSTVVPEPLVIVGCWIIGYAATRHIVSNYDEPYAEFISAFWGLLLAQLGWLSYHFTVAYDLQLPIKLPQIALLSLVLSFVATKLYVAGRTDRLRDATVRLSAILSVILLLIIVIFSRWDATI